MKLFLFTSKLSLARKAEKAGIFSVIVDWERIGKEQRQAGHDFEINADTAEDASRLATELDIPVTVRINPIGPHTEDEIETAISAGAQVLMLPLAKDASDVAAFLELVGDRAMSLIQIETQPMVERCADLLDLDWDFAHIGLNDLRISRNSGWLWEPVYDGTVQQVCRTLQERPIGFAGGTIVGGGAPIPFIHLLREMCRLNCGMCILRRTFKSEIQGRDLEAEFDAFYAKLKAIEARSPSTVRADHQRLLEVLQRVGPVAA